MKQIEKRLRELEMAGTDQQPVIHWDGTATRAHQGNRPVLRVRWAKDAREATADPSGKGGAHG